MIFPDVCFVQAISFKDDGRSGNMRGLSVTDKRSSHGKGVTYKKGGGAYCPPVP